jgi:hypothetical protein
MDKTNFKKAIEPEHIKITEIGQEISGVLVGIEVSTKYSDGYAIKYYDGEVLKGSFINKQAYDLFINNGIKSGQEFILVYKENKISENNGLEYRLFELYFK